MIFDRLLNISKGISGYRANLFSLKMKKTDITHPKIIRQMTLGESQGKEVPPKFRPSNSIIVRPRTDRLPNQSIALTPSKSLVLGLWTSRKNRRSTNATAVKGKFTQKIHRHERSCVRVPPRMGPIPPATVHIHSQSPRYRLRCLRKVRVSCTPSPTDSQNLPHAEYV